MLVLSGLVSAYNPFTSPERTPKQRAVQYDSRPGIGLKVQSHPSECEADADNAMRCWATQMMAREMPGQYLCNVSDWPRGEPPHPALDPKNLADFLLPPNTHLLLFGTSHVRSVRHVLVSAANLHKRPVNSSLLSLSDDCDEKPDGITGEDMRELRHRRKAGSQKCGIFEDRVRDEADLILDEFPDTFSSILTIVNHRQYQLPEKANALGQLLGQYQAVGRPLTHGYFTFPHDRAYFDAHCDFIKGGPKPDPHKVGDGVEEFCKIPECVDTSPLFRVIRSFIPDVGFRGSVSRLEPQNSWPEP